MNEKEFNLSKIIMAAGAKNAPAEIKEFIDDLELLSSGIEARFEDISDQVEKISGYLDVTKYSLTMNDLFKLRSALKKSEYDLTVLKANFASFKTEKIKTLLNLLDKQCRFRMARGYEIIKKYSEKGGMDGKIYKAVTAKYDMIDYKIGDEIIKSLEGKFSRQEYRALLDKYDDSGDTVGRQFIKTTMLVMALAE